MASLPPAASLPHAPDTTLTAVLDLLFEPSPPLHALALPVLRSTTFATYTSLIAALAARLTALAHASNDPAATATLDHILASHPRLGATHVDSALSRHEQAGLLHDAARDQADELAALNRAYEDKFGGLRYVYVLASPSLLSLSLSLSFENSFSSFSSCIDTPSVFVNARPRTTIMQNMRDRIARGDLQAERLEAIQAMRDIACDRAGKLEER